jgi:2-polyprenyl-3-methyl-5-hydroxy-6-metoxy-1,4-benzoquinol methylase
MIENKEGQARYYDELFSKFEYANSLQLLRAISILDALSATGVTTPRILDFGCGSGWLTNILAMFGPAMGVELSSQAVLKATNLYPAAKFEAADVFHWSHSAGSFDVVVSQEVIEHVEDQARYLELAASFLRDKGFLILTTPNAYTMMAMPEPERTAWSNQPIENWLTPLELRNLLRNRFDNIQVRTIIYGLGSSGSYRVMNSTKLAQLMAKVHLDRPYDWMRGHLGYGLHTVATARKK